MSKPRPRSFLKPALEKRLASYALAGAAALGATSASSLQAEVVYTAAHLKFTTENDWFIDVPVDLNNDGRIDFQLIATYSPIIASFYYGFGNQIFETVAPPNRVAYVPGKSYAQAFSLGAKIGRSANFTTDALLAAFGHRCQFGCNVWSIGEFVNTQNKTLGVKFLIGGEVHFGWARINVQTNGNFLNFELVDYAYQTIPDAPILAGEGIGKSTADAGSARMPATLGTLAFGASALPLWRRGDATSPQH